MPTIDDSKCILVTGATSGIGRSLALALAQLPNKPTVVGAGRRKERLEELTKADLEAFPLELGTDFDALKKSVDELLEKYPNLDAVILNAGIQNHFNFKTGVDLSEITHELAVNYTSVVAFASFVLPHFLKLSEAGQPAFFIMVTSGLSIIPGPFAPNYSASKAATHSITTVMRAQLSDTNIRIIEIIPPHGLTNMLSKFWMPLEEYTKLTIQDLRDGKDVICASVSQQYFDKHEDGKYQIVLEQTKPWETWDEDRNRKL
ncbi:hypothetical protein NLJ89_g10140 [Agrocybe chaxingu]|uniref:NAD(P)-binding protein n=1 Tax=Agrocybe chaxingu TaxID=84603 RepID=A0A9W8JR53_9AGAR|nr:hypothetical protein NLJ89_g10140 [Agrocybe chaxingu]